ncbi:MAG: hypothetical protein CL986_04180 [Euryarchaeota archaeon]|nr:hypothetical protein [Euryarchaeota archaeon]MAN00059.1 hypothetical protein [Euryarchaeota archaeon]
MILARVDCLSSISEVEQMAFEDLTEFELRLLKWISASDFVEVAWSTKRAADAFKVEEKEVYEALAALTAKVRDNIHIYYDEGAIRIVADDSLPS